MSATMAPDRTLEQRRKALKRANEVRCGNAAVKVRVRARRMSFEAAMLEETCQSMKVFELLVTIPTVGRVKANKALATLGVSPNKRVGGLTDRQRNALVAWARPYSRSVAS